LFGIEPHTLGLHLGVLALRNVANVCALKHSRFANDIVQGLLLLA
jgi:hypothetical protein